MPLPVNPWWIRGGAEGRIPGSRYGGRGPNQPASVTGDNSSRARQPCRGRRQHATSRTRQCRGAQAHGGAAGAGAGLGAPGPTTPRAGPRRDAATTGAWPQAGPQSRSHRAPHVPPVGRFLQPRAKAVKGKGLIGWQRTEPGLEPLGVLLAAVAPGRVDQRPELFMVHRGASQRPGLLVSQSRGCDRPTSRSGMA
jgi:hypothetical protein